VASAAAMDSAIFDRRDEPGLGRSALLAAAVHLLLAALLVFGVSWQSRAPEIVTVELWEPPPASVPDAPREEQAPPPVEAKPEPPIEKPQIVEKPAPKPKPKPAPKVEAKPPPKPPAKAAPKPAAKTAVLPPPDDTFRKRMLEEVAREQAAFSAKHERDKVRDQLAREAVSARERGLASWMDKVSAKIRSNMMLPPDLKGNPEAVFEVVQLPTGELLGAKLKKSSGNRALDEAIERAILKSSPLPKPDRQELFQRSFDLKYRPHDL